MDADQFYLGAHIMTSALKRVDVAVFSAITAAQNNGLKTGINAIRTRRRADHFDEENRDDLSLLVRRGTRGKWSRNEGWAFDRSEVKRRVLQQDRLLELLQRLARVEAKFVHERGTRVLVSS